MSNVIPLHPKPHTDQKWFFIEKVHEVRGIEIWIAESRERARPEFLVVLSSAVGGVNEVGRVYMSEFDAGTIIMERANEIALVLRVAEASWITGEDDPDPGGGEALHASAA